MQDNTHEIVTVFPNGFKQIRVPHGAPKTRYLIVDPDGNPVSSETFTGAIYLKEDLFEVYQGEKSGCFMYSRGSTGMSRRRINFTYRR